MALSTSRTLVTKTGISTTQVFDMGGINISGGDFNLGSNIKLGNASGIITSTNFKTGSTNVHNVGIEIAGINVLGADTPIGTGSTIYDDGGARFSGIVTASGFSGDGSALIGVASTDNIKTSTTANFSGGIQVGSATTLTGNLVANTATANSIVVGSAVTVNSQGIDVTGVVTATSFSGALAASNLTGALPAISGANLTGLNSDVVSDSSPQLGGDLDVNGRDIVSTSNADIDIIPNGSGKTNFGGTNSIVIPSGTTAQRANTTGAFRFNTNLGMAEYYDGSGWRQIDSPPTITNFTLDGGSAVTSTKIANNAGGNATIVINGNNFDTTSGTVAFEGEVGSSTVNTQSIVRNSATQFTVTVTRSDFLEANDPYRIKVTNGSGLAGVLGSAFDVNLPPAFVNSADTNLTNVVNSGPAISGSTANASATDADGDTITYSIVSGSLPTGLSLGSSNGYITGSVSGVTEQEYTFTVRAATAYGNTDRQFKITVVAAPSGGSMSTSGGYTIHRFTSSGAFVNTISNLTVDYLVVAGGGGGGAKRGGGGGAGGMRTGTLTLSTGSKSVSIGGGGGRSGGGFSQGNSGSGSSFDSISCTGGGRGGCRNNGGSGGSGGGNGRSDGVGGTSGGSGTSGQGNPGGGHGSTHGGSGGGGKNGAGSGGGGGNGGAGQSNSYGGSSVTYAQGGQGGTVYGTGGNSSGPGSNRGANSGHGADGGDDSPGYTGGAGGSGIVIVRYQL